MDGFYAALIVTVLAICGFELFRIRGALQTLNGRLLTIAEFFQLWVRSTAETTEGELVSPAQALRQLSDNIQEVERSLRKIAGEAEGQTIALQAIGEAIRTHLPDYRGPLREIIERAKAREGEEKHERG